MVHKGPVRPKGPSLYPVVCQWCTRVQFGQKGPVFTLSFAQGAQGSSSAKRGPVYTLLFAYTTQGSSSAKGPSLLMNLTEWYGKATNNTYKL